MAAERVHAYSPHHAPSLDRPKPGKGSRIPGDRRREVVDGIVYIVRSWDTFVADQDDFRRTRKDGTRMEEDKISQVVNSN